MRHCAFLTLDAPEGWVTDDDLTHEPLRALGWEVTTLPWNRPGVDWSRFEAVVIRSTWDYFRRFDEFLATLETIDRSSARLANPLETVRWNLRKTYLRDLEARSLPVVPTLWQTGPNADRIRSLFDELETDEIVLKPVVSASAYDTFRIRRDSDFSELAALFSGREVMAQPFLASIVEEGEYSLFYFDGELSHTILKSPKEKDFRVQEEHGGWIRAADPPAPLPDLGHRIVEALPVRPLYARVDLVRHDSGFVLMELELVEPSLYFRIVPGSAERFARAFAAWMLRYPSRRTPYGPSGPTVDTGTPTPWSGRASREP
jgi:glutathione synthase/RimK-type ligase-like ATP-grasp enzyme